ncbi:hypothetical protein FRC11_001967, partial [Ceratobasidium sp. 423]
MWYSQLQFIVEECETGKTGSKDLDFEVQRKAYNTHLTSHGVWLKIAGERWSFVQKLLFRRAFKNSGAHESALPVDENNVLREEDLQANVPNAEELEELKREMAEMKGETRGAPGGWDGPNDKERDPNPRDDDTREQDRYRNEATTESTKTVIATEMTRNTEMSDTMATSAVTIGNISKGETIAKPSGTGLGILKPHLRSGSHCDREYSDGRNDTQGDENRGTRCERESYHDDVNHDS